MSRRRRARCGGKAASARVVAESFEYSGRFSSYLGCRSVPGSRGKFAWVWLSRLADPVSRRALASTIERVQAISDLQVQLGTEGGMGNIDFGSHLHELAEKFRKSMLAGPDGHPPCLGARWCGRGNRDQASVWLGIPHYLGQSGPRKCRPCPGSRTRCLAAQTLCH